MATQCRSSKCTAEKKGFRRELDSWRYKLIHCVGFESILEGIYGTRLLRDLSIFDDCEPDVVNDWSVDASCSFCSLQLEKIGDHSPVLCSLRSSPTEEAPPQGQSNTEKIEYQADKFLHAIFRKKDPPQSCDPNIPFVAQELMKKMIRQFAIEYASKSQIQGGKNGSSVDVDSVCDGLQCPPDQDGPLDLTVNRNHPNVEQGGGVLDLSQKSRAGFALSAGANASTTLNRSGTLELAGGEEVHMDTHEVKHTVLEMVLSSFCPYHRMLLYHILKCIHEDYIISATPYADGHSHFSKTDSLSCHLGKNPDNDMFAFTDYRTSDGCYVHSCRLDAYSVTPGCFCLKNLHYLSCQRMAFGCISKFVSPNSCGGYAHPQRCACPFQGFSQSPYTMRSGLSSPFSLQKVCDPLSPRIRACRSSPPPLSPMPLDVGAKPSDNSLVCPFAGSKCFSSQPPSLFVQEVEDDPLFHKFNKEHSSTEEMEKHTPNEDCTDCCTQTEKNFEQNQSGTLLQNLMERINKQLKCIEPLEKEQNLGLRASQTLACSSEVRLGEILSTVLHKETDNDYNLKELLCQHQLIVEEKSIQTHFHRKKDSVTAAGSTGLATCPHRCLQIKRELASLCTLPCRRKLELEKQGENVARDDLKTQLSCVEVSLTNSEKDNVSENKMSTMKKHDCDNSTSVPCTVLLCSTLEDEEKPPEVKKSDQEGMNCRHRNASIKKHRLSCQPVGDSSRSRRNIVPPQRFSAYVTEPRKMYFAACFSESIFSKRAHKDAKAIGGEMSSSSLDLNESSTKLNLLNETSKTTLQPKRLAESKHFSLKSADCHLSNASRTRSGKLNHSLIDQQSGDGEVKQCIQRRSKRRTATSHSCVKLASLTNDQNDLAESIKTREDAVSTSECSSLPPYSSPIRLMFVSPVVSEEGVKYSLKSANSGSISQQETFDPCEESSWGGPAKSEEEETEEVETLKPRVTRGDESNPLKRPVTTNDSSPFSEEHNMQGETCFLIHGLTLSPPKRKPGRPKKLGPQIEKPAKRPIGRPPKHKAENSKCVSTVDSPNAVNKNSTSHSHSEDDGRKNKNLKITVVFGRSRRIRRLVSESSGHLVSDQQMNGGLQSTYADGSKEDKDLSECSVGSGANAESSNKLLDGQTENFDFVMPVKNKRSHTNRNIKCAEQKCSVAMRKPGRPPKVKISGISVTVTTVSPKRRNICINKDMTELHNEMSQKAKPFISHHENPKEQTTISLQSDVDDGEKIENIQDGTMSQKIPVPLRHSVRIRKPSIHLLHSVATSRTFTRSNALLRRSRKLLLNKTSSDSNQKSLEKPCGETSSTMTLESPPRNAHGQDLSFLSGISVDSIFTNEPFKWWPTSASAESLNAEFTRRVQLLSDTWVTESSEGSKSISTERELNLKSRIQPKDDEPPMNYFSPVKMLFQTHWNMDKLCAWFMQTTETQSLAIVKKASVRNPYEIVQYNPTRTTSQTVCPSPQAERLRMHVKKFAKIVPKSPAMHRQAQKKVFDAAQLKIKRRLVSHSSGTVLRSFGRRCLLSRHKMLGKYGFLLLRVKSKFMSRKKICHSLARPLLKMPSDAFCGIIPCPSKEFQQTFSSASPVIETENCSSNVERELRDRQPEKTLTDVSQEERICSKTWSPERLKECRVFLKKINSPETKSAAEECNFCTIKLDDVSSSGYSLPSSTVCADRNVKKESRRSPQILSPSCPEEQQILSRKQKRKSHGTSGSQPAKMARQSLNSGQNGQKWSLCQKAPNNRKTILLLIQYEVLRERFERQKRSSVRCQSEKIN